jgi:hypothetical protein
MDGPENDVGVSPEPRCQRCVGVWNMHKSISKSQSIDEVSSRDNKICDETLSVSNRSPRDGFESLFEASTAVTQSQNESM